MIRTFSEILWLMSILSYTLIFFYPDHEYIPYANNVVLLYAIHCWLLFIVLCFSILVYSSDWVKKEIVAEMTSKEITDHLNKLENPNFKSKFMDTLYIIFLIFVGVFVTDYNVALVVFLNMILLSFFRKRLIKVYKEVILV